MTALLEGRLQDVVILCHIIKTCRLCAKTRNLKLLQSVLEAQTEERAGIQPYIERYTCTDCCHKVCQIICSIDWVSALISIAKEHNSKRDLHRKTISYPYMAKLDVDPHCEITALGSMQGSFYAWQVLHPLQLQSLLLTSLAIKA